MPRPLNALRVFGQSVPLLPQEKEGRQGKVTQHELMLQQERQKRLLPPGVDIPGLCFAAQVKSTG